MIKIEQSAPSSTMNDDPSLDLEALCLDQPLYSVVKLRTSHRDDLANLRRRNFQIDAYCLNCSRECTFKTSRSYGGGAGMKPPPADWEFSDGDIFADLNCQRCN